MRDEDEFGWGHVEFEVLTLLQIGHAKYEVYYMCLMVKKRSGLGVKINMSHLSRGGNCSYRCR